MEELRYKEYLDTIPANNIYIFPYKMDKFMGNDKLSSRNQNI